MTRVEYKIWNGHFLCWCGDVTANCSGHQCSNGPCIENNGLCRDSNGLCIENNSLCRDNKGRFTHTMPFPCRDSATTLPLPCHSPAVPNTGRSPTCRLWTADANSYIPCSSPAANLPWPWEFAFRTAYSWKVGERHGMCESNTAALCKSNGKDTI
jgi:hypothetical protein